MTDDHQALDGPQTIGTIDYISRHGGQPVQIEVTDTGQFRATVGEVELEADYLDRVRRQIDDTVYGHRIEVPFVNLNGYHGTMRGFHAAQRKVLVTWDDGDKDSLDSYEKVYRGGILTDAEVDSIKSIRAEIAKLQAERKAIEAKAESAQVVLADAIGEDLFDHRRHDPVGV